MTEIKKQELETGVLVTSEYIIYGESSVNVVLPSIYASEGIVNKDEFLAIANKIYLDANYLSISVMDAILDYISELYDRTEYINELEAVEQYLGLTRDAHFAKKVLEDELFELEHNRK